MAARVEGRPRQVVIFDDRIFIWRGFYADNVPREYAMTRKRAHQLGWLLDMGASIRKLPGGTLYWTWNEFS